MAKKKAKTKKLKVVAVKSKVKKDKTLTEKFYDIVDKYVKPFFFSGKGTTEEKKGRIKPIYFWATLFLFTTFATIIVQIVLVWNAYKTQLTPPIDLTGIIGILAGLVLGLIAVYNNGKKKKKD